MRKKQIHVCWMAACLIVPGFAQSVAVQSSSSEQIAATEAVTRAEAAKSHAQR